MKHQLYREQQLNCGIETAWDFFSSPKNLAEITPPAMGFRVVSKNLDIPIYEGMIIDYTVSPLLNIPMKWRTRITQVAFQHSFTDFQEKGPYKYWSHFHEFVQNGEGVLIKDTIDYDLPLGFLGDIAHAVIVSRKLLEIFAFRHQVLEKMFNHILV